jgi:hypothetical protein
MHSSQTTVALPEHLPSFIENTLPFVCFYAFAGNDYNHKATNSTDIIIISVGSSVTELYTKETNLLTDLPIFVVCLTCYLSRTKHAL